MKIGVFVPIGNNGWLISTHAPQYMPTFELNKAIVQKAEHYHFDFALSMIKLRGFGGKTEFWDHNPDAAAGDCRPDGLHYRLHLRRPVWRQSGNRLAKTGI